MSQADSPRDTEDSQGLSEEQLEPFENLAESYDADEPVGKIARFVLESQSSKEDTNS